MTKRPLVIENVGEDTYALLSRGHHDLHDFMKAVRDEGYDWPLGMPEHIWLRAVPTRRSDLRCMYVGAKQGEGGAFPATYVSEAYGDERYEAVLAKRGAEDGR